MGAKQAKPSPLVEMDEMERLLKLRCTHGNADKATCEQCRRGHPMSFWEEVMNRRTIEDAERIAHIHDRLRVLEIPWWQPLRKRYWRSVVAQNQMDVPHR